MRILGIDFGERRIGVAISDPAESLATPLATLSRRSDRAAVEELIELARSEQVEAFIVGEPRRLDGSRGEAAERAASFARKLERASGLPCELVDEALTSVAAEARLRAAGVDPRRHPERVDAVAAQILLAEALERRRGGR
ncbi:MAG: Holliday junction resolvase RuvX [Acidobacteriota bacterium]|nr:Holliday junction resolvase RuvX [Acidobacteriota bacterium]MDH3522450.1 Holliday junction resolvase RuvX [Acidobacteriota bacterium]